MANNCLVKKLKASVNTNTPMVFGAFKFTKVNGSAQSEIRVSRLTRNTDLSITVTGDYSVIFNENTYTNTTFTVTAGISEQRLLVNRTSESGSVQLKPEGDYVDNKFVFKFANLLCANTMEELCGYSPYFLISMMNQGANYGGSPKFSTWLNLVDDNLSDINSYITTVNRYQTNIAEDSIDYTKFGKLVNVTNITDFNTLNAATLAAAMVSNGRTSGVMNVTTNVVTKVRFGSSMVSPTAEETAQGYQIA